MTFGTIRRFAAFVLGAAILLLSRDVWAATLGQPPAPPPAGTAIHLQKAAAPLIQTMAPADGSTQTLAPKDNGTLLAGLGIALAVAIRRMR